ncbi:hypothetical protein OIU77_020283 [Salix suchowensis]|uniref:Uncharacterized protein n=1 Tax=Salix suchowensis TaxID=1278906 RepID=A0ABQ9CNB3_9ROSI|nr:hypothetical protein OIU77_020283 [Salix suchowensis]
MFRSRTLVWIKRLDMHSNSTSRSSAAIFTASSLLFALYIYEVLSRHKNRTNSVHLIAKTLTL